jgi:hypothetical protein
MFRGGIGSSRPEGRSWLYADSDASEQEVRMFVLVAFYLSVSLLDISHPIHYKRALSVVPTQRTSLDSMGDLNEL